MAFKWPLNGSGPMRAQSKLSTRHAAQLHAVMLLFGDRRSDANSNNASRQARIGMFLAVAKSLPAKNTTPAPARPLRPLRLSIHPSGCECGSTRMKAVTVVTRALQVCLSGHGANALTGKRLNGPRYEYTRAGHVGRVAVP